LFSSVRLLQRSSGPVGPLYLNRRTQHYESALLYAALLISATSFGLSSSGQFLSMMFTTWKVFETFVQTRMAAVAEKEGLAVESNAKVELTEIWISRSGKTEEISSRQEPM
jgi:5-methylcytosine-specific restriction endonuclease McrBC regulatory subunit McrC